MSALTDDTEIPVPDNSGSSGEQEAAIGEVLPIEPQKGMPVVDAIVKGITASPRSLGEFGSALLVGAARQIERESQEVKEENRRLRESSDAQRNALEHERVRNANLTQRLASEQGNRHLRNFSIAVGTALALGGLVPNSIMPQSGSWILTGVGVLLLLISWFSPIRRGNFTSTKGDQE